MPTWLSPTRPYVPAALGHAGEHAVNVPNACIGSTENCLPIRGHINLRSMYPDLRLPTMEESADEIELVDEGATGFEHEDVSGEGEIEEPFDPSLIRVESKPLTVSLLMTRIRCRGEAGAGS
jgi:hypothetical protein